MKRKFCILMLSLAMIATMMPLNVFANEAKASNAIIPAAGVEVGQTIQLPVDNKDGIVDEGCIDEDGYVNFTVLDKTTNAGTEGVLLLSEKVLKDNASYQAEGTTSAYADSDLYTWCNGLLNAMPEELQGQIVPISKDEPEGYSLGYSHSVSVHRDASTISEEKIFPLSTLEAFGSCNSEGGAVVNSKYFPVQGGDYGDAARVAYNGNNEETSYWMRTPGISTSGSIVAGRERIKGGLNNYVVTGSNNIGYRPALNLQNDTQLEEVTAGVYKLAPQGPVKHTVVFRSTLGFTFEKQQVEDGQFVTTPVIPEGFIVKSWFTLGADGEHIPFDFDAPITSDLTVYGETVVGHIVTYMDGNEVYLRDTVEDGQCATKPDDPVKEGYKFNGWFVTPDAAGGGFDFENTPITEDITLYADWIPNDTPTPVPVPPINPTNGNGTTNGINTGDNAMAILFAGLGLAAAGTAVILRKRAKNK